MEICTVLTADHCERREAQVADWYSPAPSEHFDKRPLRITGDVFVEATEFGDVLMTGAAEPALELPFVQGIEVSLSLSLSLSLCLSLCLPL